MEYLVPQGLQDINSPGGLRADSVIGGLRLRLTGRGMDFSSDKSLDSGIAPSTRSSERLL